MFPPPDFHTTTLVGNWIYIIGNLGYLGDRIIGETPVYRLNCTTFAIEKIHTRGNASAWISSHRSVLRDRQIHIWGGQVWTNPEQPSMVDNETEYILNSDDQTWSFA